MNKKDYRNSICKMWETVNCIAAWCLENQKKIRLVIDFIELLSHTF